MNPIVFLYFGALYCAFNVGWSLWRRRPIQTAVRRDPPDLFIYTWWVTLVGGFLLSLFLPVQLLWIAMLIVGFAFSFRMWLSWQYGPIKLTRFQESLGRIVHPAMRAGSVEHPFNEATSQREINKLEWNNASNWTDSWPMRVYNSPRDSRLFVGSTLNHGHRWAYLARAAFPFVTLIIFLWIIVLVHKQ